MTKMCIYAERRINKTEPMLCRKRDNICDAQKWCKVTEQYEMNERVNTICKFYKAG